MQPNQIPVDGVSAPAEPAQITNQNPAPPMPAPESQPPAATPAPDAPASSPAAPSEPTPAAQSAPQAPAGTEPAASNEADDYEVDIPTFNLPQQQSAAQQPTAPTTQDGSAPASTPDNTQIPELDPAKFSDPNTGEVDMARFTDAMRQRDQQLVSAVTQRVVNEVVPQITQAAQQASSDQVIAAKREERLWEKAFEKYPQLKENRELRDIVHKARMGAYAAGSNETPLRAAERIFKYVGAAKAEGIQQATQSVELQNNAHLETANIAPAGNPSAAADVERALTSRDPKERKAARQATYAKWIADGVIPNLQP